MACSPWLWRSNSRAHRGHTPTRKRTRGAEAEAWQPRPRGRTSSQVGCTGIPPSMMTTRSVGAVQRGSGLPTRPAAERTIGAERQGLAVRAVSCALGSGEVLFHGVDALEAKCCEHGHVACLVADVAVLVLHAPRAASLGGRVSRDGLVESLAVAHVRVLEQAPDLRPKRRRPGNSGRRGRDLEPRRRLPGARAQNAARKHAIAGQNIARTARRADRSKAKLRPDSDCRQSPVRHVRAAH